VSTRTWYWSLMSNSADVDVNISFRITVARWWRTAAVYGPRRHHAWPTITNDESASSKQDIATTANLISSKQPLRQLTTNRRFTNHAYPKSRSTSVTSTTFNPLTDAGSYSATSKNMKLVRWPLMGGLLHLVQRGGDWTEPQPAQPSPRCTKCNSSPTNGQCTNHRIAV